MLATDKQTDRQTGYPSIDKPWLKYYSDEAINAKIPPLTMYQYAYNKNKENMSTQCFDYFGRKIYYSDFFEKVKLVAGNLQQMGVGNGDVVTIMSMHTPETLITIYALNYIGAIANMVYMTISEKEVTDIIKNTDSKLFFALDIVIEKVNEIEKHIDIPIVILEVSDSMPIYLKCALKLRKILKRNNYIKFSSILKNADNKYEIKQFKDNLATAIIVYTSGTTGCPKGVMLSNDCINAIAYQCSLTDKNYKRGETYLACMQFLEERRIEYLRVKWKADVWDEELTFYHDKRKPLPQKVREYIDHVKLNSENAGIIALILVQRENDKKRDFTSYMHLNWEKDI